MKVSVLASGSSGNSTYIESKETSILIDVGISVKRIAKNLSAIGKTIDEIDAVFITHEHIDHTKGLERLNKNFDMPIFINKETFNYLKPKRASFFNNKEIKFKDLEIEPISVSHDALDPCGFLIKENSTCLGIFTDLGKITFEVKEAISKCNSLVLETNHDIDMLINGPYPYYLKERILSSKGHLSNIESARAVKEISSERLKSIFFAHLSIYNNKPEIVMETFSKIVNKKKYEYIFTKRDEPTELKKIN